MADIPARDKAAHKSLPPDYYTYITKPKFRHKRYTSPSYCYELHTGHLCVDGYYPTVGEMASAVLSEGLLLILLKEKNQNED